MLPQASQNDDILIQITKLCILFDPSVIDGPEDYMPDESLVFFHPSSLPSSRKRSITGHLHAITNMTSEIRPAGKPIMFTFQQCIVTVVTVDKYFLVLSGPLTMPQHTLIAQLKLLVDAIFFFSGPLSNFQQKLDDPENSFYVHINNVLAFMLNYLISERASSMRSTLGYMQSRFNIPTECILRTASTIDSLPGVSGGVVLHKGKLVFSSLPNDITSLLLSIDSSSVPAEPINTDKGNNMEVFIVYIPFHTWSKISYPDDDIEVSSAADILNGVEFGDEVSTENISNGEMEEDDGTYEFISDDLPELPDTISMTSHSLFRSISSTQGKYSLKSELFEGNKPVSPLTHYDNKRQRGSTASLSSHVSIKSSQSHSIKAMVDNVFYDSLNSPEFYKANFGQNDDSLDTQWSGCPGNSLNYKLLSDQHLEESSESSECMSEFHDAVEDTTNSILKKWSWVEDIDLLQYTEAELAVQHIADTTLLLIGTGLSSNTLELWNTSIVLLGEISAAINTESVKVKKKVTAGINNFVYNRVTGLLSYNVSWTSTKESQAQILFCRSLFEEEEDAVVVCASNSNGSVAAYRTSSSEVYQTSKDFSIGRLSDGVEETLARNFDCLHL